MDEAARLLRSAGRYEIHELLLEPDRLPEAAKSDIERTLTRVLRVGVRLLTRSAWRTLREKARFSVVTEEKHPLLLLDPRTVLPEEGVEELHHSAGRHPSGIAGDGRTCLA